MVAWFHSKWIYANSAFCSPPTTSAAHPLIEHWIELLRCLFKFSLYTRKPVTPYHATLRQHRSQQTHVETWGGSCCCCCCTNEVPQVLLRRRRSIKYNNKAPLPSYFPSLFPSFLPSRFTFLMIAEASVRLWRRNK